MIQQNQLDAYIQALKDETTNIYSKKAYDALDFHCRDCITLASIIGNTTKKILDIGSGCGFPAGPAAPDSGRAVPRPPVGREKSAARPGSG